MKRLICLFMTALLVLSLSACGEKVDTNSSSSQIKNQSVVSQGSSTASKQNLNNTSSKEDKDNKDTSSQTVSHTHDWGQWLVVEAPTEDKLGKLRRTCRVCKTQEFKEATMEDVIAEQSKFGLVYTQYVN